MKTMIHKIEIEPIYEIQWRINTKIQNVVLFELIKKIKQITREPQISISSVNKFNIDTDLYNLTTETPHDS